MITGERVLHVGFTLFSLIGVAFTLVNDMWLLTIAFALIAYAWAATAREHWYL